MVKTASTMLPLGTQAPEFSLPDAEGKTVSLGDFADAPALLVAFMCNHCPYVKHVADGLASLAREYQQRGVAVVGVNSNDVASHPDDAPPKMAEETKLRGYTFPYLYDATQGVAKAYRAALDAVLAGQPVPQDQRASLGCNIKWKPGNEPDYFQ